MSKFSGRYGFLRSADGVTGYFYHAWSFSPVSGLMPGPPPPLARVCNHHLRVSRRTRTGNLRSHRTGQFN